MESARNGDLSAFREIFDRYRRQIYAVSLEYTGNHHDAEDVMQDVLIKVYRSLDRFRGDASLGSWLYRITINTCIDRERRVGWRMTAAGDGETEQARLVDFRPRHDPERHAESGRIRKHIDLATRRLSPMERSVFILRHYEQLPYKDVARALNRSEGTVKNLLFRAVRKLQKELAPYRKELGMEEAP